MPRFYTSIQASKQMLNSLHSSAKETIAQPNWSVCIYVLYMQTTA